MKRLLERWDAWLKVKNIHGVPNYIPVIVWLFIVATISVMLIILCK